MDGRVVAVVEIGSEKTRCRIAQAVRGDVRVLDTLQKPLLLGHEAFTRGQVGFPSLDELTEALFGFSQVCQEYGVSQTRVVATSALREADNRAYVADQLKIRNKADLEILEEGGEMALLLGEAERLYPERRGNLLAAYIGTGTMGLTLAAPEGVLFGLTLPTGSLKLGELFRELRHETVAFDRALGEYIDTVLHRLRVHTGAQRVDRLLIAGADMPLIRGLSGHLAAKGASIGREELRALHAAHRGASPAAVGRACRCTEEQARSLQAALALYAKLSELAESDRIDAPPVDIIDILLRHMLFPAERKAYDAGMERNLRSAALYGAARYGCDMEHARCVHAICCRLFDRLRGVHGLPRRKRCILEAAALLHDIGQFQNAGNPREAASAMLANMRLFGLSGEDEMLLAQVARYCERERPGVWNSGYRALTEKNKLLVAKLSSMLCLACALDEGHKGRCRDVQVRREEGEIRLRVETDEGLELESWAVEVCAPYFAEIYGLRPRLQPVSRLARQGI